MEKQEFLQEQEIIMQESHTHDPFAIVRAAQTDAMNFDLDNDAIIARLQQWQSVCTFRILAASADTVDIQFDTLPDDMDEFVRALYDFCPDLVDQGTGCLHEMLEESDESLSPEMQMLLDGINFEDEDYGLEVLKRGLQQTKSIQLWWD